QPRWRDLHRLPAAVSAGVRQPRPDAAPSPAGRSVRPPRRRPGRSRGLGERRGGLAGPLRAPERHPRRQGCAMSDSEERERRWRLAVGGEDEQLGAEDARLSGALTMLYGEGASGEPGARRAGTRGGLQRSAPSVARWLGDIRTFFPTPVV